MKEQNILYRIIGVIMLVAFPGGQRVFAQEAGMFRLAGFATINEGTSGGAGGDTIWVTTGTALQDAIKSRKNDPSPLVIMVEGKITLANSAGLEKIDVKEVEGVSVIGGGEGAEFDGIGLKIFRAGNIIIRNLKIHHVSSGEKDCISIEGPAHHIWIDHCELFNEYPDVDKDFYDGLLDAKADCEYITYSWNFLHDSWKTALVGSSESDIFDRKITMHHNYFLNCNSRLPLYRASTGHFFNNYFKQITSTVINSRINSCVRLENNYFENANNPWVSAYSDILGGGEIINNILVNSPFQYSDDTHELPACTPEILYTYNDILHDAEDIPGLVTEFAGVGKNLTGPSSSGNTGPDISDDGGMSISTWPNPLSGQGSVSISVESAGQVTLFLISTSGSQTVLLSDYFNGPESLTIGLNMENYPPGLYMAALVSGNQRKVFRLLVIQ